MRLGEIIIGMLEIIIGAWGIRASLRAITFLGDNPSQELTMCYLTFVSALFLVVIGGALYMKESSFIRSWHVSFSAFIAVSIMNLISVPIYALLAISHVQFLKETPTIYVDYGLIIVITTFYIRYFSRGLR